MSREELVGGQFFWVQLCKGDELVPKFGFGRAV